MPWKEKPAFTLEGRGRFRAADTPAGDLSDSPCSHKQSAPLSFVFTLSEVLLHGKATAVK